MAIIEVKNLTKKYDKVTAVDDISFEVFEGEVFGILGPNGAGKTTTLEMLEGLKGITSGKVTLDNKDVATHTREVKSVIGVQLQASSFFEGLSLIELINTFASFYNRKVDAMELLKAVQLEEKAKSEVKELSGGQKQRMSIAVALVNDPKILFLDEPTTGLDPQARHNLWELVRTINGQGKTIVITTHYMDEAEVLCDRIAVMDHAKIVALDETENLLKLPGLHSSVNFRSNKAIPEVNLSGLTSVMAVNLDQNIYSLITTDPEKTLSSLFELGHKLDFQILDLQLKQPTLEDVFLKLTGHGLRE